MVFKEGHFGTYIASRERNHGISRKSYNCKRREEISRNQNKRGFKRSIKGSLCVKPQGDCKRKQLEDLADGVAVLYGTEKQEAGTG